MRSQSRRQFLHGGLTLAGLGLLTGCELSPWTQQPAKIPRVGYLTLTNAAAAQIEAFRDGLRELGYVEGQTIIIEERLAESTEQFPDLASELVGLPVNVIVAAGGTVSTRAAKAATSTIPIVFPVASDPVGSGLVASLNRPGGNITGSNNQGALVLAKRLQLMSEMVPGISRVIFLTEVTSGVLGVEQAAQSLGLQLATPHIRSVADLPAAFEMAVVDRAEALLVDGSPLMAAERGRIVEFAMVARLPAMAEERSFPAAGGLGSYGANRLVLFRRAATYVDKILKGAKPADLPVEQPSTYELVINLTTAQALALTIPQSVLQQATEIIQ